MNHFSVRGMALGAGVTWAIANFLAGITAMHGYGGGYVDMMASLFRGYGPTFVGAFIGGAWGFFDGMIGGALFSYFYNHFSGK